MESADAKMINFFEGNKKIFIINNHIMGKKIKRAYIIIFSLLLLIIIGFSLFFILGQMKEESYNNMKDNKKLFLKIEEETFIKGENEKCLTCEEGHCGSCNIGYKLKEGKYVFTYSFKATYEATISNKMVRLFNYDEKKHIL